ncbi:MAG: M20/M25/M40 family metallo-hydrolase [Clostridia bacterium]|nr:M20/M25/M40 family metallo-hydrolase [Clostridia bacterium]
MNEKIKNYIAQNGELAYQTLKELCLIPAPSHFEHERAEYCKKWLEGYGAKGVYIDEALNVIYPINCDNSNKITVFAAHTDTVFPDREPMPYHDDGQRVHCPGCADDTASVVSLLLAAKFYVENKIVPQNGIMFVFNSCEEGLGNLKGTRKLFEDFEGKIESFITLDSNLNVIADHSVGSHRYEVTVLTEGGHSFGKFGNKNAIAELCKIVNEIYKINVPAKEGTKTTYNVGTIEGGTSVNTIAQSAKMLCEYRSDDKECLDFMQAEFMRIFDEAAKNTEIKVEIVGERPCSITDKSEIEKLKEKLIPIIEETINEKVSCMSGSTDCNIPLALGVKALCIGSNVHEGQHTREEWVDKESILTGTVITIRSCLALTKN